MKKLINFYLLLVLSMTGCNIGAKLGKLDIEPDKIKAAAEKYKEKIYKYPEFLKVNYIKQIDINGQNLKSLLHRNIYGLKLLTGYDEINDTFKIYIDFIHRNGNPNYYDIEDEELKLDCKICIRNNTCADDINTQTSANPDELKESDVVKFSENYWREIVKVNGAKNVIREINFDARLLKTLLGIYGVEKLKLIPAALNIPDPARENVYTLILQFKSGGNYYYYDAGDFFKPDQPGMRKFKPICPPPYPCEISR